MSIRWLRPLPAATLALSIVVVGWVLPRPVGAGDGAPLVEIEGRGWGHGRGMGQFGALGYALDHGWDASRILDHYYGGTRSGPAPQPGVVDPDRIRVDLRYMRSRATTVARTVGSIRLVAADGTVLRTVDGAVRLTAVAGAMDVATAPDCDGPWVAAGRVEGSLVKLLPGPQAEPVSGPGGLLQVCGPSHRTWYEGEIWAARRAGVQRTVNVVPVEQYLRGVVPNEVPARWPAAVLEAQAVAARSYLLAGDGRFPGVADTCDDTICQVYDGRYSNRGGALRASTHERTDAAVAATAGIVRLRGDGRVARTEFSSSSGGHTAGGDFPPVVDLGDSVAANPNHRWSTTVDLSALEARYGLGPMRAVVVLARDGVGADGGRVREMEYRFERGAVTVSGSTARRQLGLRSEWFTVGPVRRGGGDGDVFDREEIRARLVADLYRTALGRKPDVEGRRYWEQALADGLTYEHLGTLFYGSPEYVRRSGGTDDRFVTALYRDLLGRPPDADGRRYWLAQLAGGRAAPADVANGFYRSIESRRDRVRALYALLALDPPPTATVEAEAQRLGRIDDLTLAIELLARAP